MASFRILQLFSRYLQYGGEEAMFHQAGEALSERHHVENFVTSSEKLLEGGVGRKLLVPALAFRNGEVIRQLNRVQDKEGFDCWLIHNVFSAISPAAYSLAFRLGVPVIHYLHNYKFGCTNGFNFREGKECRECQSGNFWPAVKHASWHGKRVQSTVMAGVLAYTRSLGVFEKITRWVAISEAQKQIHVEMGIPADRIDVVHHYLDESRRSIVTDFPDSGHAIFVGRLSPEKGVDRLLLAWSHLPRDRKLVILGDGPEMAALRKIAHDNNLWNVSFEGFVSQERQAEYWAGALFSVVPSIWQEPFGMVVLEAWGRGRPVVGHRVGALPEIVEEGVNGFLANPDDPLDLATVLETAFRHADLEEMGRNGMKRLHEYYHKSRWLDEMDAVFQKAGLMQGP